MASSHTLVLVGGGHAHLQLLKSASEFLSSRVCGRQVRRILVSDHAYSTYSGMIPSVVSGRLSPDAADVSLHDVAKRHGWEFIQARVEKIDASKQRITCMSTASSFRGQNWVGPKAETSERKQMNKKEIIGHRFELQYTVLSLDIGSTSRPFLPRCSPGQIKPTDAPEHPTIVPTRPIGSLLGRLCAFEARTEDANVAGPSQLCVTVVGGGAAGVELVFALEARFRATLPSRTVKLTLVDSSPRLSQLGTAAPVAMAELRARGIHVCDGEKAVGLEERTLVLKSGARLRTDLIVAATGAAAHPWTIRNTDLDTDDAGFFVVQPNLRSTSHSNVFGSGDCISFSGHFGEGFPPKAGVYAVRMGPVLEKNIGAVLRQAPGFESRAALVDFKPQVSYLSLLATGDGRAIGSKWNLVVFGRWVFRLKMHLDQQWQDQFKSNHESPMLPDKEYSVQRMSAVEAASVLLGETHNERDDFRVQHQVLLRMDNDQAFRTAVMEAADGRWMSD